MKNRDARRYLRETRGWLPCSLRLKRNILGKIRENISRFLEEDPAADYNAIVARFGTPQQIASAYVDEMGTMELLQNLRIKRKLVRIVAAVGITVVLLWGIGMTVLVLDGLYHQNGIIVVTQDFQR